MNFNEPINEIKKPKMEVIEELGIEPSRVPIISEAVGNIGAKHILATRTKIKYNKTALIKDVASFDGSEVEKLLIMLFLGTKIGSLL